MMQQQFNIYYVTTIQSVNLYYVATS